MARALPKSNYVSVTWGIKEDSGGLSVALLRRASLLSAAGAGTVHVLTFDNETNYPHIEQHLRERGRLWGNVQILNIWDLLRADNLEKKPGAKPARTDTLIPLGKSKNYDSQFRGKKELSRTRYAADNLTVLQVDYYREDGTLLASDRRDVKKEGTPGGRWVTLCDLQGKPYRSWSKAREFYRWVLDRIWGKIPTTYIIDSKTAAPIFIDYHRRNALTVQIIQGAHLDGLTKDGRPILSEGRHRSLENLAQFDLVGTLTLRQRREIMWLVGASPNLHIIPNSVALPDPTSITLERDLSHGMMVAAFEPRKRVPLAVEAITLAKKKSPITFDIYGDGVSRSEVEQAIEENTAGSFVSLKGYDPTALASTTTASFLLITSTTEGTPLVMLEAMAAGCLPIAFDIPYGPSDVITDGVNGFLIPDGDVAAMAHAIVQLQHLPAETVATMRKEAIAAVQRFNDKAVVELWAKELNKAWSRKTALWWRLLRKWQIAHAAKTYKSMNVEIGPKLPPPPRR